MARRCAEPFARRRHWLGAIRAPGGIPGLVIVLAGAAALVLNLAPGAAAATAVAASGRGTPTTPGPARELPASAANSGQLLRSYLKGRDLPATSVTKLRPGSLHVAVVQSTGEQWAIASMAPAPGLKRSLQVQFQDGAGTGIFAREPGQPWHFVQAGVEPVACDTVVPAAVRAAWNLAPGFRCGAGSSPSPSAVSQARARVDATPSLANKIVSIALSQAGVRDIPAVTSFDTVDCDPYTPMVGPFYPDPDSRGCGYNAKFRIENENETWCADFAEWVWLRAGVSQDMDLINPGADSFYDWGLARGESLPIDGTDPKVGDAVVLYPPGQITSTSSADHVGIVTAVHADGTLNIVNGDFLGTKNISVQYNTNVNIGPWAAAVEGDVGEQWVFVTPPTSAQPASPTAQISGPPVVAAGTQVTFRAEAAEAGGSITSYAWAFGNGEYEPNGAASGSVVQHVFADPGLQTVSMIATSNLGTITVRTLNVDVVTSSSALISTPSDALYYPYTPVAQSLFTTGPSGGLAEESWDGASWLDEDLPGDVAAGSPLATLQYKNSADVFEPHVFARSADGALTEISADNGAWSAANLPESVARGSAIAATTIAASTARSVSAAPRPRAYPAVFSYDSAGQLTEAYQYGSGWRTAVLPVPPSGQKALSAATSFAGPVPQTQVFSAGRRGALLVTSLQAGGWRTAVVASGTRIAAGSALAAVSSPAAGSGPAVFFVDQAGHLAVASQGAGGAWSVQQVSATPVSPSGTLLATDYVPSSGSPRPEVFALSASGQPLVSYADGGSWRTEALPGTGTSLLALGDYAVPGSPQEVFFRTAQGIEQDSNSSASGSGAWTLSGPLPATPATFADRVILYAATQADLTTATQAAKSAGLPASAVTGSFAVAWDDGISGNYLVITVGLAATDGLYFNPCGWANPSDAFPGSTPFLLVNPPVDQLPAASNIEEAAGSSTSQTPALAYDLAYYALHGALPPGVTALPAEANPQFTCSGEPSV
jgi:PKD repeat protein